MPHFRANILYAEDDPHSAKLMDAVLREEGYEISVVPTGVSFLEVLEESQPDLCLLDLNLPDISGLELLQKVQMMRPGIPVMMVTASDSIEDAVRAMQLGAADYVSKPVDIRRLTVSINHVLNLSRQQREIDHLRSNLRESYSLDQMVGSSQEVEELRHLIGRVAPSESTVLITGESGTGKELLARSIHQSSERRDKRFLDVNCAALSESLLESELFGHEKGAFTGADQKRRGQFEQADGGTLFLDEIGDMPMATQKKILRFLEDRSLTRVGGEQKIQVNVRIVCATNQELEKAVSQGQFRQDLFYRINTVSIHLPPLRSRTGDIPELAHHFLAIVCRKEKRRVQKVSQEALTALSHHSWPGNIRELQHAIERAVLMCEGTDILPEHLPPAVLQGSVVPRDPHNLLEAVETIERTMIRKALNRHDWVKRHAARSLGITERMISYKIHCLGIERSRET